MRSILSFVLELSFDFHFRPWLLQEYFIDEAALQLYFLPTAGTYTSNPLCLVIYGLF